MSIHSRCKKGEGLWPSPFFIVDTPYRVTITRVVATRAFCRALTMDTSAGQSTRIQNSRPCAIAYRYPTQIDNGVATDVAQHQRYRTLFVVPPDRDACLGIAAIDRPERAPSPSGAGPTRFGKYVFGLSMN